MSYSQYTEVAEEDHDVIPISHSYIPSWQFPFEYMNDLIFIL